jgi:stage IV sporulation protein FB
VKLKIHPLFFALALLLIAVGQGVVFFCTFLAVFLHELAHAAVARSRGYLMKEIVLLPYGAALYGDESIERGSAVIIALAGPLTNGLLALLVLALWWLFPSTYSVTEPFLKANLVIGAFNLLPAYPLDGARVVLGLCKNKPRALKGLKIAGVALSVFCVAAFVVSAFFAINFTVGILGVFLFLGATAGTEKEMYLHVASHNFKNFGDGVCERTIKISGQAPLVRTLRHIKPDFVTKFVIVDRDGCEIERLTEDKIKLLCEKFPLQKPLLDAVRNFAADS